MRYRDCPTVEVTERIDVDVPTVWAAVCDITLPVRCAGELQSARWLGSATEPVVGAQFEGVNRNEHLGEWTTISTVVDVEEGRRWVWEVGMPDGPPWSRWGFEVDPLREGVLIRQWHRMGPERSGLNVAIDAMPEREGRIIEVRLTEQAASMQANLAEIKAVLEGR